MRKFKKFMFSLHRIMGTVICLFLLMWFVSGLVLVYHPFPDVTQKQKNDHMDILSDSLPDILDLATRLSLHEKDIKKIDIKNFQKQDVFTIKTKDSVYVVSGDNDLQVKPITKKTIVDISKKWVDAPILKIDTLYDREIWIMYSKYEKEMPIYKVYFDDDQKYQLYISSISGEVQQFTNKEQRFWTWIGSIPHKFYIPVLRKNTDMWIRSLTIGGTLVLLTALSGMFLGINILYKRYKNRKKIGSPYKKKWYKWHHISGLIFGLFIMTFAFSGAMALQRIPQWVIKTHGDYKVSDSKFRGKSLSIDQYHLNYRDLKKKYKNIKSIEWSHFQNKPIFNIVNEDKSIYIDASSFQIKEVYLTPNDIEIAIRKLYGDVDYILSSINEYEEYYMSRTKELPLPVYKVDVANLDKSSFYINPLNGEFKYVNKTNRVKKWVFSGLHYLNIKFLIERPLLWNFLIWALCIGGSVVSLTGVYLGFKFTYKKTKKKRHIKNK